MAEIMLVRHAQSLANLRDFAAFGNRDSPLTDKGRDEQCPALAQQFEALGIEPRSYKPAVAASEFIRAQETARHVGFPLIEIVPIINETETGGRDISVRELKKRHLADKWVPEETAERVARFITMVRSGELEYRIYFAHGVFTAAAKKEVEDLNDFVFDERYGYIPAHASITIMRV